MISLVIGDDQRIFVEALTTVLGQQGFTVLAVGYTLDETIAAVRARQPDVCLVERGLPGCDETGGIRSIIDACPGVKVVILSADGSADGIARAIESGATGYVDKTRDIAALTTSIQRVVSGEIVVDTRPGLASCGPRNSTDPLHLAVHLTARERECLQLLVEGMDTKAMAQHLGVAATTIRSHVQATLTKLGTHSRLEAAALAVRYGLLGGSSPDQNRGGRTNGQTKGGAFRSYTVSAVASTRDRSAPRCASVPAV